MKLESVLIDPESLTSKTKIQENFALLNYYWECDGELFIQNLNVDELKIYAVSAWTILQAWYLNWPEVISLGFIQQGKIVSVSVEILPNISIDEWLNYCKNLFISFELVQKNLQEKSFHETFFGDIRDLNNASFDAPLKMALHVNEKQTYFFYNKNLFSESSAYKILGNFINILMSLFKKKVTCVHETCQISEEELNQIMQFMKASLLETQKSESVISLIRNKVSEFPNKIAVTKQEAVLTYLELDKLSDALAQKLLSEGVLANQRIAIYMERSLEMILSMLAILKIGASFIPIDPMMPEFRVDYIIKNGSVALALLNNRSRERFFNIPTFEVNLIPFPVNNIIIESCEKSFDSKMMLFSGNGISSIISCQASQPIDFSTPSSEAYVIYTSGTTGDPKGISISHKSLSYYTITAKFKFEINPQDKMLQFSSISFDAMIEEIFPTLIAGAEVVLREESVSHDVDHCLETIKRHKITILDLPTAYWKELIRHENLSERISPLVRLVIIGGEAISQIDILCWKRRLKNPPQLVNTYGPTETTVVTTMWFLPTSDHQQESFESPLGEPIPGSVIFIVDLFGKISPIGAVGEIYISGPGLALGYINDKKKNEEKFVSLREFPYRELFFKSGDRGKYLEDGNIEYLGRSDNQVKINGFRVELDEIKNQLVRHPNIKNAFVLAINAKMADPMRIVGFVSIKEAADFHETQILNFLKRNLPGYMLPNRVIKMNEFPKLVSGKVDLQKLKEYFLVNVHEEQNEKLNFSSTELLVANLWEDVLHRSVTTKETNFFDLGGSSLDVIRLITKFHQTCNIKLDAYQIYLTPSLKEFAAAIDSSYFDQKSISMDPFTSKDFIKWRDAEAEIPDFSSTIRLLTTNHSLNGDLLLTGATGFFGIHLLNESLKKTKKKIYCLVRASNPEAAQKRIFACAQQNHICLNEYAERIIAVPSDISQQKFGLSDSTYAEIAEKIEIILHCAAEVNMLQKYEALRAANVFATKQMIEFAQVNRLKELHFISSLAIFDDVEGCEREISEDSCLDQITYLAGGYAQSKWVADRAVLHAIEQGLPAKIYRCGRIWGDSDTGVMPNNDFIWKFIKGCLRMGSVPEVNMTLDVVPVDFLANLVVTMIFKKNMDQNIFHLANSQPITLKDIYGFLSEIGIDVNWVDYDQWKKMLIKIIYEDNLFDHILAPIVSVFDTCDASTWIDKYFRGIKTEKVLQGMGLLYPAVTKNLFHRYLYPQSVRDSHDKFDEKACITTSRLD